MNRSAHPDVDRDPLGFSILEGIIRQIRTLSVSPPDPPDGEGDLTSLLDRLEHQLRLSRRNYDLLTDRYALLKRSTATLTDELVWLRDQIDDLSSGE